MIATYCRSCSTVDRAICVVRCKYCGSQHTQVKSIDDSIVKRRGGREVLEEKDGNQRKTRSSTEEA